MPCYNDNLNQDEQVEMEERIACAIFHHPDIRVHAETANLLGRTILHDVLRRFRPDVFEDYKPKEQSC